MSISISYVIAFIRSGRLNRRIPVVPSMLYSTSAIVPPSPPVPARDHRRNPGAATDGAGIPAEPSQPRPPQPAILDVMTRTKQKYRITGGNRLYGRVRISGSKNGADYAIAAALLSAEDVVLHNVPDIGDVRQMEEILAHLGCTVEHPVRVVAAHQLRQPQTLGGARQPRRTAPRQLPRHGPAARAHGPRRHARRPAATRSASARSMCTSPASACSAPTVSTARRHVRRARRRHACAAVASCSTIRASWAR